MTDKASELSKRTDWCETCERGWSWVSGNEHSNATRRLAWLEGVLAEASHDIDTGNAGAASKRIKRALDGMGKTEND